MKSRVAMTFGTLALAATFAVAHHSTAGIYEVCVVSIFAIGLLARR